MHSLGFCGAPLGLGRLNGTLTLALQQEVDIVGNYWRIDTATQNWPHFSQRVCLKDKQPGDFV